MRKNNTVIKTGVKEWADFSVNCCTGCLNDCKYCYARSMAERFKQVVSGEWKYFQIRQHDVNKNYKKYDGRIMFPTSHDIFLDNLDACCIVLEKLLKAGNYVLVVSKPNLQCIKHICSAYQQYRENILFRFTIGAMDDDILSFWEPGAPSYAERKACLIHAYENGFNTSVSVEPMLDAKGIDMLIYDLMLYITDSMWIGKMNHIGRIIQDEETAEALKIIVDGQTDEMIQQVYSRWKTNVQIKWKDSIRKVVGLPVN